MRKWNVNVTTLIKSTVSADAEVPGRITPKHQHYEKWAWHDGEPGDTDGEVCTSKGCYSRSCSQLLHSIHFFHLCLWRTCLTTEITDLAKEVHDVLTARPQRPAFQTPNQQTKTNKPQFFINSSNKKAKSVTLHIQGLDGVVGAMWRFYITFVNNTGSIKHL